MPVKYNLIECMNLLDKTTVPKFYTCAKVSLKSLAKEIV